LTVRVEEIDLELSPVLARRDRDRERGDRPERRGYEDYAPPGGDRGPPGSGERAAPAASE
jgi:hypothetical protein